MQKIDWIKVPLLDCLDWQEIPPEVTGRVILKKWPAETQSAGGIELPGMESRRVVGVAWVYRAMGDAAQYLHPGDAVLVPQYAVESGLRFPGGHGLDSLDDFREIDVKGSVYHVLPYAKAQEWRQKEASEAISEADDALPKIQALADGGECSQAIAWLNKVKVKAAVCIGGNLHDRIGAMETYILQKADEHARDRARKAEEEERVAKYKLNAEREKLRQGRMN